MLRTDAYIGGIRTGRTVLAALLLACICLLAAASAAHAAPLYVSLTFDDGTATQYANRDVLEDNGVRGTYYVNSGKIGLPSFMTWPQAQEMQADGHEVGGHTRDHRNLTDRAVNAVEQVCDDRTALIANGIDARNFAYPFGAGGGDAGVRDIVRGCGYDTARTTGGTDYEGPDVELPPGSVLANQVPVPTNQLYRLRAFQTTLNTPLEVYRDIIERGRDAGGGWLPIVLHDVCALPCTGVAPNAYYISRELLDELIRWIKADPQLRIRTTAQVMAIGGDVTAPVTALTAPADGATVAPGPVALAATASDAVGVERVDFYVGGDLVGSDDSAPYEAEWDASGAGDGERFALSSWAYDDSGNLGRSAANTVTVVVPDTTGPVVALTAPGAGATVTGTVGLTATATDPSGIDRVEFLVDGAVVATDDAAPYAASWDSDPSAGRSVALSVRARDALGNVTVSAASVVQVAAAREPERREPDPREPDRRDDDGGRGDVVDPPLDPPPGPRPPDPSPPTPTPPTTPTTPTDPPVVARDRTAPTLRLRATVVRGKRIAIHVTADDPSGVREVRLLVNGVARRHARKLLGGGPRSVRYGHSWLATPGRYSLVAVVIDRRGNVARSRALRVTVAQPLARPRA